MATMQKIKPCPDCGNADLDIYTYEHGGRHVECDACFYLGPCANNRIDAVRLHNDGFETARAAYDAGRQQEKVPEER